MNEIIGSERVNSKLTGVGGRGGVISEAEIKLWGGIHCLKSHVSRIFHKAVITFIKAERSLVFSSIL